MARVDLAGARWRKSTRSGNSGECVEVAEVSGMVGMRDSKDVDGPVLVFSETAWRDFVHAVARGEFDLQATQESQET